MALFFDGHNMVSKPDVIVNNVSSDAAKASDPSLVYASRMVKAAQNFEPRRQTWTTNPHVAPTGESVI